MNATLREPVFDRDAIVALINEAYSGPAWHGPSVKEALAGVTSHAATKKLAPDRNSIWELVLHLAHGRHLIIERIVNAATTPFPRPIREPWWPIASSDTSDASWQRDLALLDECHARFIDAIQRATAEQLARIPQGGDPIHKQLAGMALHDTYHAGQIRLLALEFATSPHSP